MSPRHRCSRCDPERKAGPHPSLPASSSRLLALLGGGGAPVALHPEGRPAEPLGAHGPPPPGEVLAPDSGHGTPGLSQRPPLPRQPRLVTCDSRDLCASVPPGRTPAFVPPLCTFSRHLAGDPPRSPARFTAPRGG